MKSKLSIATISALLIMPSFGAPGPDSHSENTLLRAITSLEAAKLEGLESVAVESLYSRFMQQAKLLGDAKTQEGRKYLVEFTFVTRGSPSRSIPPDESRVSSYIVMFSDKFDVDGVMKLDEDGKAGMFRSVFLIGTASMDLATPIGFSDFKSRLERNFGQKRKPERAEQAGTEQPATRTESKSEGGDKPQPEAEGRSR